jgi:hypothetical protein
MNTFSGKLLTDRDDSVTVHARVIALVTVVNDACIHEVARANYPNITPNPACE